MNKKMRDSDSFTPESIFTLLGMETFVSSDAAYGSLVHAVLFGSHYYADAKSIARKFI